MFNLHQIMNRFSRGNVIVFGVKGSGKDMLMGNVIARRRLPYVCNVSYGYQHFPLYLPLLDLNGNKYDRFIDNDPIRYEYPYPDLTDVYISDAGVYMPAQYNSELNRDYPTYAALQALTRHLGDCAVHCNAQSLNRVWDKIREQADCYILCKWCRVFFGKIVIQSVVEYDRYESALNKVEPCHIRGGIFGTARALVKIEKQRYRQTYGYVKKRLLIYRHKAHYDTRFFKNFLGGGTAET